MKIPATVRAVLVRLGFLSPVTFDSIVGTFNKTVADLEAFAAEQDANYEQAILDVEAASDRRDAAMLESVKANRTKAKIVELIG